MKKITLLFVALFAMIGSAFAALPTNDTLGYLTNKASGKSINASAKVADDGAIFQITDMKDCGASFGSDDGSINESGYTYARFMLMGTSNYMRMTNSGVICSGTGYHKWAIMDTEKGLVIRCIYTSTQKDGALNPFAKQGYYLTPTEDGTLELVETPTEASYWTFDTDKAAADIAAADDAEIKATQDALAAMNEGAGPKATDDLLATLFPNAGFEESHDETGWTVTWKDGNKPSYAVANNNCGMTKYQGTIKMEKTIKGLPAGWYTLKAQAFARKGNNASNIEKFYAKEELETPGVIFANNETKPVKNIVEGPVSTKGDVDPSKFTDITIDDKTMYILNNSTSGSYVFSLDQYELELNVSIAEGEALTFGFDKDTANTDDYCGCDNFRLYYIGEDPTTAISSVTKKAAQNVIFNVAGQQMKSLQKGLNIVDGKKIYMK